MTERSCDWFVIINPMAGDGKGERDWALISNKLEAAGISFTHRFTLYPHHALELIPEVIAEGCRTMIIVGGDGFLNEVVNGIFNQQQVPSSEMTLGLIPVGTGNDWVRTFGIPGDYEGAIRILKGRKTLKHDIGKVSYFMHEQQGHRYFINMCGMGFDAEVAKKVNADKGYERTGPLKYQYHIFSTLMGYHPTAVKLTLDGTVHAHEVFSMTIGICQYNGGGMKQLPYAIPDDGIFDITVIEKISRLRVMRNVKHLYDGSFATLPEIKTFTAAAVEVDSDPRIWIEVDGESLGHSPFRFEMLKHALNVIVP